VAESANSIFAITATQFSRPLVIAIYELGRHWEVVFGGFRAASFISSLLLSSAHDRRLST
jgi:hypothetical protein